MGAASRVKVTYAEYLELERRTGVRHEFLDGEAWAMAGGTPEHAQIAFNASAALRPLMRGRPCRGYSSDLKLRVPATGRDLVRRRGGGLRRAPDGA